MARRVIHRRFADRSELVLVDALGIVQQPADQRGFAVVHAARGREAQQFLLFVLPEKVFDIGGRARSVAACHQK